VVRFTFRLAQPEQLHLRAERRPWRRSSPPDQPRWRIFSTGSLIVNGTTFNDNTAQGGEIRGLPITAVAGGEGAGGAVYAMSNPLTITNSTFAYNRALGGSGTAPEGQALPARGDARGGALAISSNSMTWQA
jgi:hypothetical protein